MRGVLLDTHILLWWRTNSRSLSRDQVRCIEQCELSGEPLSLSAISLWELAKMADRGRVEPDGPIENWLEEIEQHPLIQVLPVNARIAAESVQLGAGFPRDPADQIIVATARCHGLRLLTADERIQKWGRHPIVG